MSGNMDWSAEELGLLWDGAGSFGATLRRLRQGRGLSQRSIVRRMNLSSHSSIADFESGRRVPHRDIVSDYERIFEFPAGTLQRLRVRELARRAFKHALPSKPELLAPGPAGLTETATPAHSQLPNDAPQFVARQEEILRIVGVLTSLPKAVGIFGSPGIGKTALAVHVAHLASIRFPDGRICVDLRGDTAQPVTTSAAVARLLRWLHVSPADIPRSLDEKLAVYQALLAGRSLMVVLDNVSDEAQVRELLPQGGDCLIMITGRRTLYGLSLASTLVLPELDGNSAVDLLISVAHRPDLPPGTELETIVDRCGGLPLALVIAGEKLAARPTWSLAKLAGLLADDSGILDNLVSGDLSVRSSFARSYALLDDEGRKLFRRASLLGPRRFDRRLASLLQGVPADAVLERLVDDNLLSADGDSYYRLPALLRRFAQQQVLSDDTSSELHLIRDRVLSWLASGCAAASMRMSREQAEVGSWAFDTADPVTTDHQAALGWYESQLIHLVAAVTNAARGRQHPIAARLCLALAPFFRARKDWAEWISTHRIGVCCAQEINDCALEAALLHSLGDAYLEVGLTDFARECFRASLRVGQGENGRFRVGSVLASLGRLQFGQGELAGAAETLARAVDACLTSGDRAALVRAMVANGAVRLQQGDLVASLKALREATQVAVDAGDQHGRASAVLGLARTYLAAGRSEQATAVAGEAVTLSQHLKDRLGKSSALSLLAECHRQRRHFLEAYEALDQARRLRSEFDHRYVEGHRWLGGPPVGHCGMTGTESGAGEQASSRLQDYLRESEADRDWFDFQ